MGHSDTLDKVIPSYFAAVTKVPFEYKGKTYEPETLRVSPLLFRGFTCPPMCGGCCRPHTLDWLPDEILPYEVPERVIKFDGREVTILSDVQADVTGNDCRNLRLEDGRCMIHTSIKEVTPKKENPDGAHPFACDFELTRFLHRAKTGYNLLTKMYGRYWAINRTDGGTGGLCEITPIDRDSIEDVWRKLNRLKDWTDHFGLETKLPEVKEWFDALPEGWDTDPAEKHAHKI